MYPSYILLKFFPLSVKILCPLKNLNVAPKILVKIVWASVKIFSLQGQSRRINVAVQPVVGPGPESCLLRAQSISSISIGSCYLRNRYDEPLDSYQEQDLERFDLPPSLVTITVATPTQDADAVERGGDEQTGLPGHGGEEADGEEGTVCHGPGETERAPGPVGHAPVAETGRPAT